MEEKFIKVRNWSLEQIHNNRWALLIIFSLSILTYFPFIVNELANPDGVLWWDNLVTPLWLLEQGRWGLFIIDYIKPPINTSQIFIFWSLAGYTLGAVLFSELLGNATTQSKVITGACIICFPHVASTLAAGGYVFSTAFLLSISSIFIVAKLKNRWVKILVGSILLSLAIGIHQGSLSIAAGAGILYLIVLLQRKDWLLHNWLLQARQILIMGLTGTALYYLILQIVLQKCGMAIQTYGGGDKINFLYILINLPSTVKNTYVNFSKFFFSSNIMVNSYGIKPLYIFFFLLFVTTVWLEIYRLRKNIAACVALLGCVSLIPLFCDAINLCTPDMAGVALHMTGGLCLFIPFVFSVFSYEIRSLYGTKIFLLRGLSMVAVLLLIWNFVLVDYADAGLMKRTSDLTVSLANRIYCSVEQNEQFAEGMKLLVIGRPDCSDLEGNEMNYYNCTNGYAQWGMVWDGRYHSQSSWNVIFRHYVDGNIVFADWGDVDRIVDTNTFKNMPAYPSQGSMQTIDDVFVVKIAEVT